MDQRIINQLPIITFMLLSDYMNFGSIKIKTTDKNVREKLLSRLSNDRENSYLLEEFDIERGTVRADVVSISNSMVHGYEIKSDSDTLLRLPKQVKYYNQVFSTVTLVVGSEHVVDALYLIPDWWGVMVASNNNGSVKLNAIREGKVNENINYTTVADLLRKNELVDILKEYAPGRPYSSMSKDRLKNEAVTCIPKESIMHYLSNILERRNRNNLLNLKVTF
jgi:hypothetical protein